ncbi:MAG: serine/threonine-protein kinase, partial [Candidatus Eremiobacterota bacterium]
MQLHEPETLLDGRYVILSLVGKGGMGAVYKARDIRLHDRIVAVKQMLEEDDGDLDYVRKQLDNESRVLQQLKHPTIPGIVDYFTDELATYVVMEFVEGTSLDHMLQQHQAAHGAPLPPEVVLEYALKICDTLIYLHAQDPPVIHRDIKPQNILVKESGEIALVDFGLARSNVSAGTKTLVGTLGYAPLEQFKGRPDVRSDLYGLGATMFHL